MGRPFPWILLLALAVAPACRARPAAPDGLRVSLTPTKRDPRYPKQPTQPPEWFEEEIAAIEEELSAGRLEEAQARIDGARAAFPGPEHEAALADQTHRLLEKVLLLRTVTGSIECVEEHIDFGSPLEVRVILRNRENRPVRIPASLRGTSGTLLDFEITAREYDARGNVATLKSRVVLPAERDFDLPPQGTTELTFVLGLAGNDRPLDGFRAYTIAGHLRPARLETGPFARFEGIDLGTCGPSSFRENWRHLADDPLTRIGQAIAKNAPVHLLTASALVPRNERQAAVDGLIAALEGARPIDVAILGALEHLTGAGLGRNPEAWRTWWPRVRDHYFDAPIPERKPGEPVFGAH